MKNIQKLIFNNNVLDVSNISSDGFASGTKILFYQASAPTGWTIDISVNDVGVRIVNADGGTIGGATSFSSIFKSGTIATSSTSVSISGNTGNKALSVAMLAAHTHTIKLGIRDGYEIARHSTDADSSPRYGNTGSVGSGGTHNHSFSGSSSHSHNITLNLKYINVIVCTKD